MRNTSFGLLFIVFLSITSVSDLAGQSAGAPNVYFATQTIRFNTLSGPYDYNPGSRFVLVRPYGADLLVQSLDTQVQMVVPPNCVTNDPEVATKAWRAWMQEQGLLAQYEQQQRQIAEAAQRAQQEREAVATAQQASAQQAEDESGPARRAETEEIEARYERMLRNTRVMRAAEDQQDLRDQARQQAEIDERAAEMGAENKLNNLETRLSSQRGPLSYSEIASYQNGLGNDLRHLKDSSLENRFQGLMSKATERANQNFDPVTLHSTP